MVDQVDARLVEPSLTVPGKLSKAWPPDAERARPAPLPLPDIGATCARYLDIASPLLDAVALSATRRHAATFPAEAEGLQRELRRRATRCEGDYVGGLWRAMYLGRREPLAPFQNAGLVLRLPQRLTELAMPRRAAILAAATMAVARARVAASHDQALCTEQDRWMFGTCRLPGVDADRMVRSSPSGHFIVACRGRLHLIHHPDGPSASAMAAMLEPVFRAILADSRQGAGVGVLTALPRARWHAVRLRLCRSRENARALRAVERSAFVLCLEPDLDAADRTAMAEHVLTGDAGNRWYDKICQLILGDGPLFGINGEHSHVDGHAGCMMVEAICRLAAELVGATLPASAAQHHELRWQLDDLAAELAEARRAVAAGRAMIHTRVMNSTGGAGAMRDDVITQLAVQLAYRELSGGVAAVYQPTHMRRFRRGRTEAVRTATPAAIAFCLAAGDQAVPSADLRELARRALRQIAERGRACQEGQGVDRHLFALHTTAIRLGRLPALFADPAYADVLGPAVLCTSSLGPFPHLELIVFAPVRADGFGIGYVRQAGRIAHCITGYGTPVVAYATALGAAQDRIRRLLEGEAGAAP